MGDLPKERISVPTRAFEDVGLDFGGLFYFKVSGSENNKAYLALFVCIASKAVHLELVSDLTTNACIAALRRFTSRRSCPWKLYSDNATNFTGSQSELEKLQKILNAKYQDSLQAAAAGLLIEWNFIRPNAPHSCGLWEAGIKSANHPLRRTMGNHVLTFKELTTLFCQVESILNSRPIGVLGEDPKDGEILTPAHLIGGTKLETFPTIETPKKNDVANCTSTARWAHIQNLLLQFWKRWHKEYVTFLQERKKWCKEVTTLKVGEIVFITDDIVAPLRWPLARTSYVYSGFDNFVRVVKVRTQPGIYNRAVHKLKKLPLPSDWK